MVEFTDAQIGAWVGAHLWPLFRIASFFMVVPIIGTQLVPMRIRLGIALLVTMLVIPWVGPVPQVDAVSLASLSVTLQQILIGTTLGFMFVMLMQLFVVAGQIIAMQMGLGFASMVDPANGVNVPVLSQFYLIATTLLFLAMNGHLVMVEVIVETFRVWPISTQIFSDTAFNPDILWMMILRISWLFSSAMMIALPCITAVLIVNIAFGVMTRAAPTMNIFSLGFPIGLVFGLFIIWVSMSGFGPQFQLLTEQTFIFLRDLQGI